MIRRAAIALLLLATLGAAAAGGDDAISRESKSGPVTAKVTLSPAKPRLGDPLTLTLDVTAEPGVDVRMPAFGEALGRFDITAFVPREKRTPAGGSEASQRYTLEAPMSGKQKVPPLVVEFVDRRPGQSAGEPRELLTEEIPVEVESVLPDGNQALRAARGPLPEDWPPPSPEARRTAGLVAGGVVLVAAAALGFVLLRRARRLRARRSAYDVALARLAAIARRGLPAPGEADAWYVELSSVVRRYIEDRYGLRAPELTTEEFIREAGRAEEMQAAHRALLRGFLERCDRVKFAAYRPAEGESREALEAARRFLDETRLGAPIVVGAAA